MLWSELREKVDSHLVNIGMEDAEIDTISVYDGSGIDIDDLQVDIIDGLLVI